MYVATLLHTLPDKNGVPREAWHIVGTLDRAEWFIERGWDTTDHPLSEWEQQYSSTVFVMDRYLLPPKEYHRIRDTVASRRRRGTHARLP